MITVFCATRNAWWHRLRASLRRRSIGVPWGIAGHRDRASRAFRTVRGHVSLWRTGSIPMCWKTPSARGREWRAWRLCGQRRGGQFCGGSGRGSRARGCWRACSARRVAQLHATCSSMPRLPGAVAPRGRQVRCSSRRPRGLGSVEAVGARQHHGGARGGHAEVAQARTDAHNCVRVLRRPGSAAEGPDGGAQCEAERHLTLGRLLRLRQALPQVAAGGAPGCHGHGRAGRRSRLARDATVGRGAGGAVDAAALRGGGPRAQVARALSAAWARAVADARLLLQGRSVLSGDQYDFT